MKMFTIIGDRVINMDNVLYFYKEEEDEDVNEWNIFKICFVFSDKFLKIRFKIDKDRDAAYEKLMKFVNQEQENS